MKTKTTNKYSPEVREQAIRLVQTWAEFVA